MSETEQCTGLGLCLEIEYDSENTEYRPQITCAHHCKPVKCYNYVFCKNKRPLIELLEYNDLCTMCAFLYGKMKQTESVEECVICMEEKKMIELSCKHRFCASCWVSVCNTTNHYPTLCPLCRTSIWKST
jgi:hypothetical protein